eukprot:768486-Hanusia_phi.AAC.1
MWLFGYDEDGRPLTHAQVMSEVGAPSTTQVLHRCSRTCRKITRRGPSPLTPILTFPASRMRQCILASKARGRRATQ